MEKDRAFIDNAVAETIKLCDDPTHINMVIVKNNLAIFRQMLNHADETIERLTKTVEEWGVKFIEDVPMKH